MRELPLAGALVALRQWRGAFKKCADHYLPSASQRGQSRSDLTSNIKSRMAGIVGNTAAHEDLLVASKFHEKAADARC